MSARKNKKNTVGARGIVPVERTLILILAMISILSILTLIIGRMNDNKNLDRIIYNAKKEAENTLISSGLATYTKDIDNGVGASIARPLSNEKLPENTETNPQPEGTIVAPKENWNIETVTAVSVGNGDTVPVPIGFYYVGGDLNTGVIISDNQEDGYDGKTDKTTWEYTTELKGNQFVWIPCTEKEYKKCDVWNGTTQKPNTLSSAWWEKTTNSSELPQIIKYGGFYVGRYEAGLAETISEFTSTQVQNSSNQVYNIDHVNGIVTKPQSRAGIIPWNFIDWNHSQTNSKNMYNTYSVNSGLITGTQWDVMLKKIVEKTDLTEEDLTSSENWGNYQNNSIEYVGRMSKAYSISGGFRQDAFGGKKTSKTSIYTSNNTGELLTTGASKQTEVYHIFDVAGNLWEWTEEICGYNANALYRIERGGSGILSYKSVPACYRNGSHDVTHTNFTVGFRVVLYVK